MLLSHVGRTRFSHKSARGLCRLDSVSGYDLVNLQTSMRLMQSVAVFPAETYRPNDADPVDYLAKRVNLVAHRGL